MKASGKWIMGIDEAGRGPLAGPVTLAAVACPRIIARRFFRGIKDSKHLTLKNREVWFEKIKKHPRIFYSVASVGSAAIDRFGIAAAIRRAISRLLRHETMKLFRKTGILLDGSLKAPRIYAQKTIIKGDERVPIIAAASVMAKVARDRKMARLAKYFPEYSLEIHKGYGTLLHRRLIKKYGPSIIHRQSFLTKIIGSSV